MTLFCALNRADGRVLTRDEEAGLDGPHPSWELEENKPRWSCGWPPDSTGQVVCAHVVVVIGAKD